MLGCSGQFNNFSTNFHIFDSFLKQHTAENEAKKAVQVLKVPFAKDWSNRHIENTNSGFLHDVHNQPIAPTTTTANSGSVAVSVSVSTPTKSAETTDVLTEVSKHESNAGGSVEGDVQKNISETEHVFQKVSISAQSKPYDWTLSSDYCCTLSAEEGRNGDHSSTGYTHNSDPSKQVLSARKLCEKCASIASSDNSTSSITSNSGIQIAPATASSIELDLLRDRDAPILFYDEFILYQVGLRCLY